MIGRRTVLAALAAQPVAGRTALSQPSQKVWRIGVLHWTSFGASYFDVLKAALADLGYVEGRNVDYIIRAGEDRPDRAAAAAAELVRLAVDVIVATATGAAIAAKAATRTIPVVVSAADPVTSGVVSNLARPEANVTGVSLMAFDTMGKCVEVACELLPGLSKVAFLGQKDEPNAERFLAAIRAAGDHLSVEVLACWARDAADFDAVFVEAARGGVGAVLAQPVFHPLGRQIAETAARHRMPTIGEERSLADNGGLLSFGVDRNYTWWRLAAITDRILRGARPADLPVEQSIRTLLVINLKTAKALGLTVPPAILARADEVIE